MLLALSLLHFACYTLENISVVGPISQPWLIPRYVPSTQLTPDQELAFVGKRRGCC